MLKFAVEKDADLTIASLPVEKTEAKRLGILKINDDSFVTDFIEKPKDEIILKNLKLPSNFYTTWALPNEDKNFLGSMGIYIFKRDALIRILENDSREDFGKHLIPTEIKQGKTAAFVYDGYWEDIGTIASFYEANMELTKEKTKVKLNTYDERHPIYSKTNHLPGTKIRGTKIDDSIICEGNIIEAEAISHSIIGLRNTIKKNTIIKDSIIMGNNFFIPPKNQLSFLPEEYIIGQNCLIKKAIIDEHVNIGNNVKLINKDNLSNYDGDGIYIRDGIIVVTAGTVIKDNFIL